MFFLLSIYCLLNIFLALTIILTLDVYLCSVQLGWCPKRLGLLACLSKESTSIRVFDIQHSSRHLEYEQTFHERPVECESAH